MHPKTLIFVGSAVLTLAALGFMVWFGTFTPAAPGEWAKIHPGMTRSEVLKFAGTPRESGWPENVTETWQRDGLICHRRLFIWYRDERVLDLSEGTWLRGCGWLRRRIESQ